MAEQFTKAGKTIEEVNQVVRYVTQAGMQNSEVQEIYDKWAEHYDQDLHTIDYSPSLVLANQMEEFYGERRDISILDVAAGTGQGGINLHKKGFQKLDALDANEKMLDKAKDTGVYSQLFKAFVGKNRLPIADDTYDAVVTTGSFVPGHLSDDCYEELIRITRKGGHIFILMNDQYFREAPEYTRNLEPRMLALQEQGLWQRVLKKTEIQMKYKTGVLFVLEKC